MKKVILAASAAALLVAPAFAQDVQPLNLPADGPQVGGPVVAVTVDTIIAAANNVQSEIAGVGGFQDTTKIFILPTAEFLAGARGPDLTSALQRDESEVQTLRAALEVNPVIVAELQRNNLTVDQVVAIDVTEEGELLIFIQGG